MLHFAVALSIAYVLDGLHIVRDGFHDFVCISGGGPCDALVTVLEGVGEVFALCVLDVAPMGAVVFV